MRMSHCPWLCASAVAAFLAVGAAPASAEPYVVGALGDSITTGFDATRIGDNKELSWATGSDPAVKSHAQRLTELKGEQVTTDNEAIAGSEVKDLSRQIDRLLTHSPDYVAVTIGANDVCGWPVDYQESLTTFESTLDASMSRIIAARPTVRIALSAIPDIHNLWQVAQPHAGCQLRWDLSGICRSLLNSQSTDTDRQGFVTRWLAANEALTRVAQKYSTNVMHNPDAANAQFTWDDVSHIDCFHPSVTGQNLLSELAWQVVGQYSLP